RFEPPTSSLVPSSSSPAIALLTRPPHAAQRPERRVTVSLSRAPPSHPPSRVFPCEVVRRSIRGEWLVCVAVSLSLDERVERGRSSLLWRVSQPNPLVRSPALIQRAISGHSHTTTVMGQLPHSPLPHYDSLLLVLDLVLVLLGLHRNRLDSLRLRLLLLLLLEQRLLALPLGRELQELERRRTLRLLVVRKDPVHEREEGQRGGSGGRAGGAATHMS
ncbi:hypothetical protein RTBOTA2_002698, partial [Rhodotorula toruloides]